jgi:hypothetical protein
VRLVPSAQCSKRPSPARRVDRYLGDYLRKAEVALYHIVALLLAITALATIASAAHTLWTGPAMLRLPRNLWRSCNDSAAYAPGGAGNFPGAIDVF